MNLRRLQTEFRNPSSEFRPAPLWVWNTEVTTGDIDRMLLQLKEQGFGGALVHPRPGLVTEYLSPEWFRLWRYALDKGKEMGLLINIYDENSYPSGFAGGHVPDEMPESYNQGQCLMGQHSQVAPKAGDCYLCVLREGDRFTDITERLADYHGKEGDYYVYRLGYYGKSRWTAGFPYVDLMAKGVTEKFIDVTMGSYEKALGKELGRSVTMTFTDEPNIASPDGRHCRWTPDLFDTFKQLWGYDLRPYWPLLGEDVGPWQKVRHDYNATLLHLFIERWSKPWYQYTEKKNMSWTGHYWEHNWPDLSQGPDNMAMYAWHQVPAIDMLFNQYNDQSCQAQFGNVRSVKELSSVANQMGYVRTLSETYGGGGWDETFEDFKRLGDWEYALGVNFMNQHLCHMTITGARKYDYPPVFTSVSPWWGSYGALNDYFGRLSLLLSQGKQQNDWLILEPTTSLWLHYTQVAGGDPLWRIANAFQSFVTSLEKAQVEYDLGCEDIIRRQGRVEKNRFCVGRCKYSTVILPPEMTNMESSTLVLLRKFVQNGGRVIALSQPSRVDGEEDPSVSQLLQTGENVLSAKDYPEMVNLYFREARSSVKVADSQDLYHHRRTYSDGELIFLTNSSLERSATASVSMPGGYLYELDAMTGSISLIQNSSGGVSVDVCIEPAGSRIYVASDHKIFPQASDAEAPRTSGSELKATDGLTVKATHANSLNLDFCSLTVGRKQYDTMYTQKANGTLWNHFGMSDPWETAVQFRRETLDADTFHVEPVDIQYSFFIEKGTDCRGLRAIIERPELYEVRVNGARLKAFQQDTLLDTRMGVFAIEQLVHEGENSLQLHLDKMSIMTEIAPVILTGNFCLVGRSHGFGLSPAIPLTLGSWKEQGWQMYAWGMDYTHHFNVTDLSHSYRVRLGEWKGSIAEVWVNGKKAGLVINSQTPDVTEYLRKGSNEITVRIIGSLKNLYGPHYADNQGIVSPWMWNGVETQRAGKDYHLLHYGMFQDFRLEY
ncbi:MAG: glycosyl hydrolase [Bacteroidaceae bacterium]